MPQLDPFQEFSGGFDNIGSFGDFDSSNNFDLFSDLREDEPSGIFFNALNQADLTPNQREFFESDQTNILNQFSGILDQALAEGRLPNDRLADFIGQPEFFKEQFQRRAPQEKAAPFTQVLRRN